MSTPETFVAYAPPAGLRCALARYEAVDSGALARMQEVFAREWLSFAESRVARARP